MLTGLEFENLLIFVIPRLCQLSVGQTQELLLSFIKNCSSEQRGFLHNEFKFLLATDIFTLPSIVLNEILSFLDVPSILNLQLVCRSWQDAVCLQNDIWKIHCLEAGGGVNSVNEIQKEHFFEHYRWLQLIKLKTSQSFAAFTTKYQTLDSEETDDWDFFTFACNFQVMAIGNRARKISIFNLKNDITVTTITTLNSASCLHVCGADLIVIGSYFGDICLMSAKDGSELYCRRVWCNPVTAFDVDPLGLILIVGFYDGSVSLLGNEPDKLRHLDLPNTTPVQKVVSLFDKTLSESQAVFCVLYEKELVSVIYDMETECKHVDVDTLPFIYRSCCLSSSDPSVIYIIGELDRYSVDVYKIVITCATGLDYRWCSINISHQLCLSNEFLTGSSNSVALRISAIAVGDRFMVCRTQERVLVFDTKRNFTLFASINLYTECCEDVHSRILPTITWNGDLLCKDETFTSCSILAVAVSGDWLNGVSPKALPDFVFFARSGSKFVARCSVSEAVVSYRSSLQAKVKRSQSNTFASENVDFKSNKYFSEEAFSPACLTSASSNLFNQDTHQQISHGGRMGPWMDINIFKEQFFA